jgi:hypothetical protein
MRPSLTLSRIPAKVQNRRLVGRGCVGEGAGHAHDVTGGGGSRRERGSTPGRPTYYVLGWSLHVIIERNPHLPAPTPVPSPHRTLSRHVSPSSFSSAQSPRTATSELELSVYLVDSNLTACEPRPRRHDLEDCKSLLLSSHNVAAAPYGVKDPMVPSQPSSSYIEAWVRFICPSMATLDRPGLPVGRRDNRQRLLLGLSTHSI